MDIIEHRVRERAYYIWEAEGRIAGRADAHWNQAEVEIAAAGTETVAKAAPKAPRAKAAAKAPVKAAAAKAPAKPKKTARSTETGAAIH